MADPSSVLGCWKITGVEPMPCGGSSIGGQNSPQDLTAATARGLAADMEIASLQDVEFTLLECGGVIWTNVVNTDLPVVNCSAYQVYEDRVSWNVFRLIRFSAWRGNIIEFVIQNLGNSADDRMMDLVLEGWCTLKCTLVRSLETDSVDFAFNFSCALQETLYPDSCIKLKDKEFEVNSFFVPEDIRKKLEGANEEILQTILYYLYNEALSPNITAKTAEKVVDFLQVCNILPGLRELCRGYAKSVSIRRQFTNIVEDVRLAVNQILTLFGGRVSSASGQVETGRNKSAGKLVICQPARLAATIKLTCKNVVYVFLKIVQFCVRYEEVRPCLSPEESSIVANFGKARLFMLLAQLIELMKAFKYATVDLTSQSRQDLAIYFVEEVEDIAIFFTRLGDEFKCLLESIIEHTAVEREILSSQQDYISSTINNGTTDQHQQDGNGGLTLAADKRPQQPPSSIKTLGVAMLTKEILSLKRAVDQLTYVFSYIKQAKDVFSQQPEQDRIRELARQMEQHVDEIPLLVLTLERILSRLQDEQLLDDPSFLYEFTSQASSVYTVINYIKLNKETFQPMLDLLKSNCYQDNIEQCLIDLGLVKCPASDAKSTDHPDELSETTSNIDQQPNNDILSDLSKKFFDSPKSRDSRLAQLGYELFTSKEGTDMVFELYQDAAPPVQFVCGGTNSSSNNGNNIEECINKTKEENCDDATKDVKNKDGGGTKMTEDDPYVERIAAHRVVVCSRCAWFRRALTSGMREDRERKIVLRDCSPEVFKIFLQFIYSGLYKLNLGHFPVQTLVDLLLVADRYEVPVLMDVCEDSLCARIEEDTAVPLLVLAEQFNTYRLRRKCFEFLACHPDLLTIEILEDLPEHLKQELIGLHTWVRPNHSLTDNGTGLVEESKNIFTSNMAANSNMYTADDNIFDGHTSDTVDIFAASSSVVDAANMFSAAGNEAMAAAPVVDINGLGEDRRVEEEEIDLLLDQDSDNESLNEGEVRDIFS